MTYESLTLADYRARNVEVGDLVRGSHGKPIGIGSIVNASAKDIGSSPWAYNHQIWPGCVKRRNS